jgi:hypothetical protein
MPLEVAMLKTVLAATTAVVIAGGALAYAQPSHDGNRHARHWRPNAEDVSALGDARIAALRAGLQLKADQEKAWPAVEAALKDIDKQRSERFAARASADKPKNAIERMGLRGERMESRGAALKKFADAAGPLYDSLDNGQKHRFVRLASAAVEPFGHWQGRRHSHRHHAWSHHGKAQPAEQGDAKQAQ